MPKENERRRPAETIRFASEDIMDLARIERRFAALLVVQGAESDLGTHVVCDRPVTLGRDADVELPLRDGSISRRHCRIERDLEADQYVLFDLGSTNGTRVNGTRVAERAVLAEGDKIFLGSTVIKFGYADGFDVEYHAKLETLVATDDLTGLLAKRKFDQALVAAVERAREQAAPLGVLVMDMDGLKQINDTHGHHMGGFSIVETARVLQDALGTRGETTRFGGDEFMSFLPGADKAAAAAVAEELRDAVAQHAYEKDGIRVAPTISIGVAALPDDGETPEDLFRAADRALYRAKAAGKNQISR